MSSKKVGLSVNLVLSFMLMTILVSSVLFSASMYASGQNSTSASSNSTSSEPEDQVASNSTSYSSEDQQSGNTTSTTRQDETTSNSTTDQVDSESQTSGNATESDTSEGQSGNSTSSEGDSSEGSVPAQEESVSSPQKVQDGLGEALTESDKSLSRSVRFPTLLFEGDIAEEAELIITWNTDGSTTVEDSRGYSYVMNVVPEGASFSLLQNSDMVVQRVEGKDIQYDVHWEPVKNSEGTEDRFKFTIVGSSVNGSEIAFKVNSEDRIESMRDGKTEGPEKDHDTFMVTKVAITQEEALEGSEEDGGMAIDDEMPGAEGIGLDWSDAIDSGYEMRFDSPRSELIVKVGKVFSIDPTTVTTTSSNLSPGTNTYFENEKRIVRVDSVLFAFYIGSGPNIAYRYSTDDGDTWSSAVSVNTGSISADTPRWTVVSTEYEGSPRIAVLYHSLSGGALSFKAKQGTVDGTSILWTDASPTPLFSVNGTNGAESAGVDTEGNIYVGFRWEPTVGPWTYSIMKSTDAGATFSTSMNATDHNSAYRTPMALTNLEDGRMLYVFAKQDHSELFYQIYDGSVWSSVTNTTGAGISTGIFKHISADSNGTHSAYVAFVSGGNSGDLKMAEWNSLGSFIGFQTGDTSLSHSLPSISLSSNATDSVIRVYSIASNKVYETKKDGSWQTPTNPFGTSFISLDQLTSPLNDVGAIWRENSASPFNVRIARDSPPNIVWTPSPLAIKAKPQVSEVLINFTSSISMASVTANVSSGINQYVTLDDATLTNIQAGHLTQLAANIEFPANATVGWYNGTITFSSLGSPLQDELILNIHVGPEVSLVHEYLEIMNELEAAGEDLNQIEVTQNFVDELNSTLTRVRDIAVDLQNLGFDGKISANRSGEAMVGSIRFFDNSTSEELFEYEFSDEIVAVFISMGILELYIEEEIEGSLAMLTPLFNNSLALIREMSEDEDDTIAGNFMLGGISHYHPSTGNTIETLWIDIESLNLNAGSEILKKGAKIAEKIIKKCFNQDGCNPSDILESILQEILELPYSFWFPTAIVTGWVYNDVDADGNRSSTVNEPGLLNWTVRVVSKDSSDKYEGLTDSDGFFNVTTDFPRYVNDIVVIEILKVGWEATSPHGEIFVHEPIQWPGPPPNEGDPFEPSLYPPLNLTAIEFGNHQIPNVIGDQGFESCELVANDGEPIGYWGYRYIQSLSSDIIEITTEDVHSGDCALRINSGLSGTAYAYQYFNLTESPYTLSYWYKIPGKQGSEIYLSTGWGPPVPFQGGSDNPVLGHRVHLGNEFPTDEWHRVVTVMNSYQWADFIDGEQVSCGNGNSIVPTEIRIGDFGGGGWATDMIVDDFSLVTGEEYEITTTPTCPNPP